jgi:hypothetical protein
MLSKVTKVLSGYLLFMPSMVYAATPSLFPKGNIDGCNFYEGTIDAQCVPSFIAHVIQLIFGLTGTVFLIMVLISGYQFALRGVTQDDSGAKERLRNAIIGMITCALSFFIIDFIISTLAGL